MLFRINIVSKNPQLNIQNAITHLENLIEFFKTQRNDENFEKYIEVARNIAITELEILEPSFPNVHVIRQRQKKRLFSYEGANEPILDPKENFKTHFYFNLIGPIHHVIRRKLYTFKKSLRNVWCFVQFL